MGQAGSVRTWGVAATAALLLVSAAGPADSRTAVDAALEAVPEPRLELMESAVRAQLESAQADVDAAWARRRESTGSELDEALAASFGRLGQLYHAYDLFGPSAACYRNAARLDPTDYRWPYYSGVLARLDGRPEIALAEFTRAGKLRPNHLPILLHLAELAFEVGESERSEALYRQVLASNPASAAAHLGLGRIASTRGEHAAAIERFERGLELQPEADRTNYLLGLEYRRLDQLELAREVLDRAGAASVGFFEPLMVEVRELAVGAGAAMGRGGDAQMLGLYDVALREYRRAVAEAPENASAQFALGSLLVAVGDLDEALEPLETAVRVDPNEPQSRFLLGHVLFELRRFAQAEPHLERALELSPRLGEARMTLAALLATTGRLERATALYREVLEAEPGDHEARLGLGKALVMMAQVEEGLAQFDSVLASQADSGLLAQAHYSRAVVEAGEGARESVVTRLENALELDASLLGARILLARLLLELGRFEETLVQAELILEADPGSAEARIIGSGALVASGRELQARSWLERGLAIDPQNLSLALQLAALLACPADAEALDPHTALGLAETLFAAERSPRNGEVLSMALAAAGRFDEAIPLQEALVAEANRRGQTAWAHHLERNLGRYRRQEPCRSEFSEH